MLSITCHRNPSWRETNSCLLTLIITKLWYKQSLRRTGKNLVNNLVQYFIHLPVSIIRLWMLQLGCLEEDCSITTMRQSQETALRFMDVVSPFAKNMRNFYFQKTLWFDNLFKCPGSSVHTVLNKDKYNINNYYLCCMIAFIIVGLT